MTDHVDRISPEEANTHLHSDANALLVCAYDSEEKFEQNHLDSASSLHDFRADVDALSRDQEVIFYCA